MDHKEPDRVSLEFGAAGLTPAATSLKKRIPGGIYLVLLIALALPCRSASIIAPVYNNDTDLKLWYNKPAAIWKEALPTGNGRIGAMTFGGTKHERIQFNEDTVWSGQRLKPFETDGPENLAEIQKLIFKGKRLEAQKLYDTSIIKDKGQHWNFSSYLPTGDLWLDFEGHDHVGNYKRELDLNKAISSVTYTCGNIHYKREVFVSHPEQCLVVRLTSSKPNSLSLKIRLTHPYKKVRWEEKEVRKDIAAKVQGDELVLEPKSDDAVKMQVRLKPMIKGGKILLKKNALVIKNANSVTLYLVAETNFNNYKDLKKDYRNIAQTRMQALSKRQYSKVLENHIQSHQAIFNRLQLTLPDSKNSQLPTDERIKQFAEGKSDASLVVLILQFGRYTLLTSSRPNTQAANLQGIWNDSLSPSWNGKYTTNINFEMNYWPVDVCNLRECIEPFVKKLEEWSIEGRKTARLYYGVNKG